MAIEQASSNRRLPILQFSVLCDAVAQDPTLKKVALLGLFDQLLQPATLPQFFVVNKWIDGIGTFVQGIEILNPDMSVLGSSEPMRFELTSRPVGATNIAGFVNFPFRVSGVHWVQIKLDGELTLSYPVPVLNPGHSE
jgi:hypothetical protein